MSTFTDDFNRADGGPGNGWTTTGTVLIASNKLTASTGAYGQQQAINAAGRQEAIYTIAGNAIGDFNFGAVIKGNAANQSGYFVAAQVSMSAPVWRIFRLSTSGGTTTLLNIVGSAIGAGTHTVRLLYNAGTLTLWADGAFIGSCVDTTYDTQSNAGFHCYTTGGQLDDYTLLGDEAVSFSVDPSPIGNFGSPVEVTFTGVASAWTPGTPGSPTFTVDHGVLSNQVVASATSATATYDPGSFLGNATFTDPSTGVTCIVVVSSDVSMVPPSLASEFDQDFIDTANATIRADTRGLPTLETIIVPGAEGWSDVYLLEALADLWYSHFRPEHAPPSQGTGSNTLNWLLMWLSGGYIPTMATPAPPSQTTLKEDLETLLARWDTGNPPTLYSAADLLELLGGTPLVNHQDIITAIEEGGSSAVLDALAAIRGDETTTLEDLLSSLAGIRTGEVLSLGDVMDAIGALPGTPTPATAIAVVALIAALALAAPTGGASVAAAAVAVGAGPVLDIATIVELVGVLGEIAALAAQVAELADNPPSTYVGPPVYHGEAQTDYGTSVELGAGGTITEAMDGVAVEISATDADHRHAYSYDGVKAYRNIGALAFVDDVGRLEAYQQLSFERAIYTPKSLAHAAGVKWFTTHGPIGTIQAWSTTP